MRRFLLTLAAFAALSPATAEEGGLPPLLCGGAEPIWNLSLEDNRGAFTSPQQADAITYDVRLTTTAKGREWPLALTLIGLRDTAIILLDQRQCTDTQTETDYPYAAHLMTQRGTEPILLTGCCRIKPAN
ncbi:hypothetical protein KHP62_00265 [Rhodobacteraceae bacterium NNCM2]|nr:hypothetical protein [Coraliihabitans acroporae]